MNKKNLSRFLLMAIAVFLFAACSDDEFDGAIIENVSADYSLRHVSINEAKQLVNSLDLNFLNFGDELRSTGEERIVSSIEPVIQNSDTVMYVINYADNNGFVIISADKGAESTVLAFSNTGNFDSSDINDGLNGWMYANKIEINRNKKQPLNEKLRINKVWSEVANRNKSIEILKSTDEVLQQATLRRTSSSRYNSSRYGDLTKEEYQYRFPMMWTQDEPYNMCCPVVSDPKDSNKKRNAKVGCTALAVGVLAYHFEYPQKWNHSIIPFRKNEGTYEGRYERARMLYNIGVSLKTEYGYNTSNVYSISSIIKLFKEFGYANPGETIFDPNQIFKSIRYGSPVVICGFGSAGGHTWIADEMAYDSDNNGRLINTSHANSRHLTVPDLKNKIVYLRMRWGWGGSSDGWYIDNSSNTIGNPSDWFGLGGSRTYIINIHPTKTTPGTGRGN